MNNPACQTCGAETMAHLDFTRGSSSLRCGFGCDDRRELHEALDVLRELVALKDGPRDAEYEQRKLVAWQDARAILERS